MKKITLVSNNICFGLVPEASEEVEQWLTLDEEGNVKFTGLCFGTGLPYEKKRVETKKITTQLATDILCTIEQYFKNEYEESQAYDTGEWELEISDADGETVSYGGSLCMDLVCEGVDLSDLLREKLQMDDLLAFDGNNKPDSIQKIVIQYHRATKLREGKFTWDYLEELIVDRKKGTVEHEQVISSECRVKRTYEMAYAVKKILESIDKEEFFSHVVGNPEDVVEIPNEKRDYKITVAYRKKEPRILEGSFDQNGLPSDFPDFVKKVFEFIMYFGIGEILNPDYVNKKRRSASEYIYCSVVFDDTYKTYYYRTEDDSIDENDFVIVPAGKDNHEAIARVMKIEYFDKDNVPFPLERTKSILRKCTSKDLEDYE